VTSSPKPYPNYKGSGLSWLGEVPAHWQSRPGFSQLADKKVKNTGMVENQVLSLSYGRIVIKPPEKLRGLVPESFETYQIVDPGDIIIRSTDLQNDWTSLRVGIVRERGIITSAYLCLRAMGELNHEYAFQLLHAFDLMKVFYGLGSGLRQNLSFVDFKRLPLFVPPLEEQTAIVQYLNHMDRRIRHYIHAMQKMVVLLAELREVATHNALQLAGTRTLRLGSMADRMSRPVSRRDEEVYVPIGLYNRGRGIFHKVPTKGSELGDSTFFWLADGDLVFSGQFAWEGAVALAGEEEQRCIASHRYPILRGKPGEVDSAYLLAFFRTPWGQVLLDHHSRGAAGRNRPLNINSLMKESVPLPPLPAQKEVATLVYAEARLRNRVKGLEALLREYRARLTADVVTGKLDVQKVGSSLDRVGWSPGHRHPVT
jgi:type I restriction enzyme S subunit